MNVILAVKDLLYCFFATALYSVLMHAPKKAVLPASATAAAAYLLYDLLYSRGSELTGYFLGTVLAAVIGETLARVMKMPATVFIFPSIVPLVPGIGLYHTMLYLIQADYGEAGKMGVKTIFIAGLMALAIALVNLTVRIIPKKVKSKGSSAAELQ